MTWFVSGFSGVEAGVFVFERKEAGSEGIKAEIMLGKGRRDVVGKTAVLMVGNVVSPAFEGVLQVNCKHT